MKKEIKKKINKNFLIYLILIIILCMLYARFIEPTKLKIEEYKVENKYIPKNFDGIKIIHFSDVHYGTTVDKKQLIKIVSIINKQKPDIVFFTGDLVDKHISLKENEIEELKKEINKINSTLGNFAVSGNHDINKNDYFTKILSDNFTILNNTEKKIYFNSSTPISIIGLTDYSETKSDYTIFNTENNNYRIVLTHEPDEYDQIKNYNINLMLSGHSHGGQVRIPFIGKIYTPIGAKKYYEDYYKLDETDFFISNGIGCSFMNFRMFSTPSINLIRLYSL